MTVAAVVVRWRGGDEVARCLRSLLAFGGSHLGRVILVDSGSGDGGAERLAASFPEVEVVALAENRSFAHATNTGAGRCPDDDLLLLNPDTEVASGAVDALAAELARRPRAAGGVPKLIGADGRPQHRWQLRKLPTAARLALGLPGAPAFAAAPTAAAAVAQPAAAAWLVRREVWQALGGLDEGFAPAWWEDVDFCARLAVSAGDPGFPVDQGFVVVPGARVVHLGGSSVHELADTAFLEAWVGNLLRFTSRHHPDRVGFVSAGLRWSLLGRAVLRPAKSRAYLRVRRTVGRRGRS